MILTGLAGWLLQATQYYNLVMNLALLLMILVAIATVVVKLTGTKADDIALDSVRGRVLKALSLLPTFGTNPLTKQMFETLKEMDKKSDEQDKDSADTPG